MKLIVLDNNGLTAHQFNQSDSNMIMQRCQIAGKQWYQNLLGFFINTVKRTVAITVRDHEGTIETMEYIDMESGQPEFYVQDQFSDYLSKRDIGVKMSLSSFEPVLQTILTAPVKARRWEVYPELNRYYNYM